MKKILCRILGHRTNRFLIEHSKEKKCLRCGEKVMCWDIYTVDEYLNDTQSNKL